MRFLNLTSLFLCTTFCELLIPLQSFAVACAKGQYQVGAVCYGCPEGCYCPKADQDWSGKGAVTCKPLEKDTLIMGVGKDQPNGTYGVFLCPKDFPKSDRTGATAGAGADSEEKCYTMVGDKQLYKKVVTNCVPGTYLPINSDSCVSCKSGNFRCPGPTAKGFIPSIKEDQGIYECNPDEKPNAAKTACEKQQEEQVEKQKEEENTGPISVKAGFYLPKGKDTPVECKETTFYCPGGEFTKSDSADQGKITCPGKSTANARKSACTYTIDRDKLKTGQDSTTPEEYQCWMYIGDTEKYKSCVLTAIYYNKDNK